MCNGRSDFDVSCCNVGCKFNAIRNNDVFSRSKNLTFSPTTSDGAKPRRAFLLKR